MIQAYLTEYCAPTLAGIKTGNLFSMRNELSEIKSEICELNHILTKKGLRLIPVSRAGKNTLLYLYRPKRLKQDLCNPAAVEILEEKGYSCENPDCCLAELIRHLKSDDTFPHEIGLFLSYPPSDVKAFMKSPREGVKCTGCWKAYSNECDAKKTFETYKKCTDLYSVEIKKGRPLEALIVSEKE